MDPITAQPRLYTHFSRTPRPEDAPEKTDKTEEAIKESAANKADALVGKMVGGTALSTSVATGNAAGAAVEAAKVAAKTMKATPQVAEGIAKGATVVSGAVAAASGDTFAAAATAKTVLENSPNLKKFAVLADAVMIASGDKKLGETIQEVKKEAQKVVSPNSTAGDRWKSGLKLAQHVQGGVILSQQLTGAARGVVGWMSKSSAFSGFASGIRNLAKGIVNSPLGTLFKKLGKLMPVLNLAALANSVRIAIDIWRDPRSSKTSKSLVVGSVASGVALFGASVITGVAAIVPAAAAFGLASELGLMATRKRDLEQGNTDRQMARYLTNPAEGVQALGKLAADIGKGITKDVSKVAQKLGAKLTGRPVPTEEKTAPSGALGAVPKF